MKKQCVVSVCLKWVMSSTLVVLAVLAAGPRGAEQQHHQAAQCTGSCTYLLSFFFFPSQIDLTEG